MKTSIWVVVLVESGIPTAVQVTNTYISASNIAEKWIAKSNPEDDEVGIFKKLIDVLEI